MKLSNVSETQNEPTRVLIANLSGQLETQLAQLIAQQPDMQLVGQAQTNLELLVLAGSGVDVVMIVDFDPVYPPPGICSHLLSEYPHLKILVVANADDTGMLYWLGLRRQQLRSVSENNLLSSIRAAKDLDPLA